MQDIREVLKEAREKQRLYQEERNRISKLGAEDRAILRPYLNKIQDDFVCALKNRNRLLKANAGIRSTVRINF